MTPLHATAQPFRSVGPVGGAGLALPGAFAPKTVQRAQPVEIIHQPLLRSHARYAAHSPEPRDRQEVAVVAEARPQYGPASVAERLSPPAKFGNFVPTLAQLIAHDSEFLRAYMPNEMRAFSRQLPAEAYQATLERSRYVMRDSLPLNAAA